MANTKSILTTKINAKVAKDFSKQDLIETFTKASFEWVDIMRDRTNAGIDVRSRRLKKLTRQYSKWKRKYISGKVKLSSKLRRTTRFKAKKVPNHGRLTGQTFTSWQPVKPKVTKTANGFNIRWGVQIEGTRNNEVNQYLIKQGRKIFGLSTGSARRKKEIDRMLNVGLRDVGISKTAINRSKRK